MKLDSISLDIDTTYHPDDTDSCNQLRYCLITTYKCNWDCDYCCVDTHNQPEPSRERVLELANRVQPDSHVTLLGGEPGMLEEEMLVTLLELFEAKNCDVSVATNGLFFIKFPQHLHRIHRFHYHCSLTLKNTVYQPPNHEELSIKYLIIVTDESFPRLDAFLTKNSHIAFTVTAADQHIKVDGTPTTKLSAGNRIKLYQNFKERIRLDTIDVLFSRNRQTKNCRNIVVQGIPRNPSILQGRKW